MQVLPTRMRPADSLRKRARAREREREREGERERERDRERARGRDTGDGHCRCDSAQLIALFSLRVLEHAEVVPLTPLTSASLFKLIG